jgi:hypothetical protein
MIVIEVEMMNYGCEFRMVKEKIELEQKSG